MSLPRKRLLRRESTLIDGEVSDLVQAHSSRQLCAESFLDGTLLEQLAIEHCKAFSSLFGHRRPFVPNRCISIGSACTGSGSEVAATHYFEQAALGQGYENFSVKHVFSCEVRDDKRAWIHSMNKKFSESGQCIFKDIRDLGQGKAACYTHGDLCNVPSCDIFICCTSCKDISRLSPGQGLVLQEQVSSGGSAQTFQGMLAYIDAARPAIVIFENVEAINDMDANSEMSNMDIVLSEFASRNYECQQMCGDSSKYGVPQKRKRVYLIAFLVVANSSIDFMHRSIQDTFQTLRSLITVCQRSPPCASKILYSASDDRVLDRWKRRRLEVQKIQNQCYSVDKAITASIASGVSWSAIQTPEILKSSPWFQTLTPQQRHVAAFSLGTDPTPALLRDISYSSHKARCSTSSEAGRHVCFTVTPKQLVLVFKEKEMPRLLLGQEALLLQGFPVSVVSDLVEATSNAALADLAGNMVSVPVLLVLLMASVASVEWIDSEVAPVADLAPGVEDPENVALQAFQLLRRKP